MKTAQWIGVLSVCLVVGVGCVPQQAVVADETTPTTAGTSPIENYKDKVLRESMIGLSYNSGLVSLNSDSDKIAKRASRAEAAKQAAEAAKIFEGNDWPAAIAAYTKAVIMDPERAESYVGLSKPLWLKRKELEAKAAIDTALKLDSKLASAWVELAVWSERNNKPVEGRKAWEEVAKLQPNNARAYERLAIIAWENGNDALAAENIRKAERFGGMVPAQVKASVEQRLGKPVSKP